MLDLHVTDQNYIVNTGSNHNFHYPIWKDSDGNEYLYVDRQNPVELGQTGLKGTRETVVR